MPYLNKRNRFVAAAKQFATDNNISHNNFSKEHLLAVAYSINMKGVPTWVLKDCKSNFKGIYDLTALFAPTATV
jgi:hypothetical protein